MRKQLTGRIVALTAALAIPVVSMVGIAPSAEAKVVCSAGVWGGNHGWGDCSENSVAGPRRWQLKTRCTWGPFASTVSSGVITGRGHVDTTCPWPYSASYSYIVFS